MPICFSFGNSLTNAELIKGFWLLVLSKNNTNPLINVGSADFSRKDDEDGGTNPLLTSALRPPVHDLIHAMTAFAGHA